MRFRPGPINLIIGCALSLIIFLFFIRASVLDLSWKIYYSPSEHLPKIFWAGLYDYFYVMVITAIFILLVLAFKKFSKVQRILAWTFISICLISVISAALNIKIVEILGKPFNYRWFYYSGFLRSADSQAAVSANLNSAYILRIVAMCLTMIALAFLIARSFEFIGGKLKIKRIWLTTCFILFNGAYILYAREKVKENEWDFDRLVNPVAAFLESVNPVSGEPELFTMEVPDSLIIHTAPVSSRISEVASAYSDKIKNVIVVVLESTPAEYVQPYDRTYEVTQNIHEHLNHAIVFDNIYAHVPATNKSMVCLLGSLYPWLSYTSLTAEYPEARFPTISSELQKRGYRTAFFNAGNLQFQKADEFLSHQGFNVIKDCRGFNCDKKFAAKKDEHEPLDGSDDMCAAQEFISWMNENNKPFFGVFWTYQTHYPYYSDGNQIIYENQDTILNRYLNALHYGDEALGKIFENLKKTGQMESTLIVVVGDHGEAFGRHEQITHATHIYEENLHIPCILINPAFKPERKTNLGGMSDIAPTIMNLLGHSFPPSWQGQSLFAESSQNRKIYFFCPWSDYLFGFREGNRKFIFNATKNTTEVYDLESDPHESKNLSNVKMAEQYNPKLAAWVQYQSNYMDKLLGKKQRQIHQ